MSRMQLALNVDDLDEAVTFYSKLFNTEPAKLKEGYANFAIVQPPLKLVLLENPGKGGTINHLGVEVESSETVHSEIARLTDAGLFTDEEMGTTCCFATQDKVWVTGPAGEKWEVYTVLSDSEIFGVSPQHPDDGAVEGGVCCGGTASANDGEKVRRERVLLLEAWSPVGSAPVTGADPTSVTRTAARPIFRRGRRRGRRCRRAPIASARCPRCRARTVRRCPSSRTWFPAPVQRGLRGPT